MFITSISCAYIFLGVAIISLFFFMYFKFLFIKTSPDNKSRNRILGTMKDPLSWRDKNNKMSYLSLFWFVISSAIFVYLKFFFYAGLISIMYMIVYIAAIAISAIILSSKHKAVT